MQIEAFNFGTLWYKAVEHLLEDGKKVTPRGIKCRESIGVRLQLFNAYANTLWNPARNPRYAFMVAEWLWIWFGREDVASIAQYNKHIAEFSDDGIRFEGAYGPPVKKQFPRMVELLKQDPDSRQAVIQIYSPPPRPTKDVPCTLSLQFLIRGEQLHTIATMRSSDVWLGLPYDVFNFTMLANILASYFKISLGDLVLNLGSSHLYEHDVDGARQALLCDTSTGAAPQLPGPPPEWLETTLVKRVYDVNETVDPIWHQYAMTLMSHKNENARYILGHPIDS